jgi:hypothetical protein
LGEKPFLAWEEVGGGSFLVEHAAGPNKEFTKSSIDPVWDITVFGAPFGFKKELSFTDFTVLILGSSTSKVDLEVEISLKAVRSGKELPFSVCTMRSNNEFTTKTK